MNNHDHIMLTLSSLTHNVYSRSFDRKRRIWGFRPTNSVTPLINHPRIQHLYSKGQHYCGKITFNSTIHDNINGNIGVQYTVFSFIPLQQAHCQRNTIEQIFWAVCIELRIILRS